MKKIISILLAIILALCVPVMTIAETDTQDLQNTIEIFSTNDDISNEYIYYSDLFYGYSTYLTQSVYLLNYSNETQQVLNSIYSDYIDSPMFLFSDIKHSLPLVFNVKEYTKMISDLTGLTSFTYENALDKANQKFAEELMGESTLAKTYGTENKWIKNINKFLKVYDTFEKNYDVYEKTEVQIYEETFQYFADNGAFSCISMTNIEAIKEISLPKISDITKILSEGSNILKGVQTLMVGLMIEDIRTCIIDEVLAAQNKNTTLYDGMSRLKKQLSDGFVSYFFYNYIENQLLKKVADYVVKEMTNDTIFVDGGFKLIGAIVDVACFVLFDVIFDIPDIDDLTTQAVLTQYSNDFYYVIRNKASGFQKQFNNEDISIYETLFVAYQATTDAAFKASEKIILSSNKEVLDSIKTKYYKKDVYSNYVNNVKSFIEIIPYESRTVTNYDVWTLNNNTTIEGGSDCINSNTIYAIDCNFRCDSITINAGGVLEIPENTNVLITGNIYLHPGSSSKRPAKLNNYGVAHINGSLTGGGGNWGSEIYNYNKLTVSGNLDCGGIRCAFSQTTDEAVLTVGGNLSFYDVGYGSTSYCNVTAGSVVLNGTSLQEVKNLNIYDFDVQNKEGIKYLSVTKVAGKYRLNGNPLDTNGYCTYIYNQFPFDTISNYKEVNVFSNVKLSGDFTGHLTIQEGGSLEIPENTNVLITGNIYLHPGSSSKRPAKLNNYGVAHINGSLTGGGGNWGSEIYNYNKLTVSGNLDCGGIHCAFSQTTDEAVLTVGGNLSFYDVGYGSTSYCNIMTGAVVLDGACLQTVSKLKSPIIILNNKSDDGVVFATYISPWILFNHGNNNFILQAGGKFVDYDGDGILDNEDPEPTVYCVHQNSEIHGERAVTCCENGYTGDTYCTDCGGKVSGGTAIPATGNHIDTDGYWETDGTQHWHTCYYGIQFDIASHIGGMATCAEKAKCSICGTEYGDYTAHHLTHHYRVEPDYESNGNIEHWACDDCGKYFSDADGLDEITVDNIVIAKLVVSEYQFIDGEVIIEAPAGAIPEGSLFDVQKIVPPPAEVVEKVKDQMGTSSEVLAYYEIRLFETDGMLIIHLDGEITIKTKMPEQYVGSKCVRILQEDETGKLIVMESWWENDYLCYKTDWLEIYN